METIPETVLITGQASVETAVEALRRGVADYLTKPVDFARVKTVLANVSRTRELKEEIGGLRGELRKLGRFGALIGAAPAMQKVYDLIGKVAPTDATVLITGETGTGKEVVAQTIHQLSRRSREPFLPLNCGAVSPNLIESELFGHERGSFTGADRIHKGYFERANRGTLFLDEVTEMPLELQVKLLRVLETSEVMRLGGTEAIKVDVRVIAATNRQPEEAVATGKLREDLLYRLNVFPIHLPTLWDRREDVELLADHFLALLNKEEGTSKEFTKAARERLRATAGRATCASCGTWCSAPSSSPTTRSATRRCLWAREESPGLEPRAQGRHVRARDRAPPHPGDARELRRRQEEGRRGPRPPP